MQVTMRLVILLFAFSVAAPALAEPLTLTLSDADKAAILAARKSEADTGLAWTALGTPGLLSTEPVLPRRQAHGEMGVMIGTGGASSIYGITSMPLGDNGWATFGFENSRNIWRGRY